MVLLAIAAFALLLFLIDGFNFAGILHRFANQTLLPETVPGVTATERGRGEGDTGTRSSGHRATTAIRTTGGTAVSPPNHLLSPGRDREGTRCGQKCWEVGWCNQRSRWHFAEIGSHFGVITG